jgi:anti-sigma factor RsiW
MIKGGPEEHSKLVALIDDELDAESKSQLLRRLEDDEALRERYDALRESGARIVESLDALLRRAPLARLRAALPQETPARIFYWPFSGAALRGLAAGIVVGLLAAGAAAWVSLSLAQKEKEDWRAAVVEYMELYTNDTFALDGADPSVEAKKLNAVADKLGAILTPERVAIPGLRFKTARILSYDGAPLAEIAYVDAQNAPVLFCLLANGGADAQLRSERRGDYSLTSWSRAGRGYLVIGRLPEPQIADLARTLERRL